jgi:hypothetical protein
VIDFFHAAAASVPTPPVGIMATVREYATLVLGGGFFVFAAAILVFVSTRKRDKGDYVRGQFSSAQALDEYIDKRIERIAKPLRDELEQLRNRELSTKTILYGFFQRLLWWDERGRGGTMPMPDAEDLEKLGVDLGDLGATRATDTVFNAARKSREHHEAQVTDIHPSQNGTES